MTVQAITAAMLIQGVSPSEKLLLIVLANYANDQNECWPSQALLAKNTGFTDRGIRKIIGSLVDKRLIKKRGRHGKGGQTSDLITLLFVPEQVAVAPPEPRSATPSKPMQSGSATPRNPVPLPPERRSDEPTNEPILEPSARAPARDAEGERERAQAERAANAAAMADLARTIAANARARPPPTRRISHPVA